MPLTKASALAIASLVLSLVALEPRTAHAAPSWLWIRTEGGYQMVDLRTFDFDDDDLSAGFIPRRASGPQAAVGAGVRLLFFTLGPRLAVTHFDDDSTERTVDQYQLWSLDLEAGLRSRVGSLEPHLLAAAGYSTFGGFDDAIAGLQKGLDVEGAHARGGLGLDYLATQTVTLGIRATGELLFLTREGISVRELAEPEQVNTISEARARVLEADGSSVGTAFGVTGGIGVQW